MSSLLKRCLVCLCVFTFLLMSVACGSGRGESTNVSRDCADQIDPSEGDVEYALDFTGDAFAADEWRRSYAVQAHRASVTWLNDESSLAHLEYLIYNCGYTQETVDDFFSDQNFKGVIFRDYDNLQRITRCSEAEEELTLYQFRARWQEDDYLIRYWVKLDSDTRILSLMLVFPQTAVASLDRYSETIFPELSVCQ